MNAITKPPKGSSLAALEEARQRIVHATSFEDVLRLEAEAAAVEAYTELVAKGSAVHAAAYACREEAARRLGQLTKALKKGKPGPQPSTPEIVEDRETNSPPPRPVTKRQRIAELGLTQQQVTAAERRAAIEAEEYAARIERAKEDILAGKRPRDITAVTSSTKHDGDEFSTPEVYIEAVRKTFGGSIDLDPASNAYAANVVRSKFHYTKEDSALDKHWLSETLYLNPPFSRGLIDRFVAKFMEELAAQRFKAAIVLTNCDPSTEWFQTLLTACDCFCLPAKRISFEIMGEPVKGNFFVQTFFYFGRDSAAFVEHFSEIGSVCARLTRAS